MRTCSVENCNFGVWGTDKNTGLGYCERHQWKRTDGKNVRNKLKLNITTVRNFETTPNSVQPIKPSQFTEMALFRLIWQYSDKKSFITGVWLRDYLNTPLWISCFMHVLPKGQNKYPNFKYYARNIVLGTLDEHNLWDNGTEEQRITYALEVEEQSEGKNTANWQKLKDLAEELRKEYKLYFPTTKGLIIGVKYGLQEVMEVVGHLNKVFFDSLKK